MNINKCVKNLKARGHSVKVFEDSSSAADYIVQSINGTEVGIGGSKTVEQLQLYDRLSENNTVYWHWKSKEPDTLQKAASAPVYITGVNALSEDGEILNIDANGNRISAQSYGKKKVYFVTGTNKIAPDFSSALIRARNIAAVKNACRFDISTPCKSLGTCHDCTSPGRICKALLVIWGPMNCGMETEVILIKEDLGF